MKKISNKQKIIILIAILAIIVIIGILIGTNAIKVNILTGKYNSSNGSSNNGNLLPEYIKAGITLGGVTGTLEDLDTSDATATAEDILWGKTAYVKGKKITGTMGGPPISQTDSYVGYYADIEGDGTVDGVIYADLAVGGSGNWRKKWLGKLCNPQRNRVKKILHNKRRIYRRFWNGESDSTNKRNQWER